MAIKFFATVIFSWIHFYLDKTRVAVIIYPNCVSLPQFTSCYPPDQWVCVCFFFPTTKFKSYAWCNLMRNSYVIDNLLSVWGCLDSQVFFTSWQKVPATIKSKCTYTNIWLAHTDVFSPFPAKLVSSSSIPSKWMCHLTAPFFEEFHNALACTVKLLLRNSGPLEAIFSSPKRGDTLDKLLEKVEENGLNFSIIENYDWSLEVSSRFYGFYGRWRLLAQLWKASLLPIIC